MDERKPRIEEVTEKFAGGAPGWLHRLAVWMMAILAAMDFLGNRERASKGFSPAKLTNVVRRTESSPFMMLTRRLAGITFMVMAVLGFIFFWGQKEYICPGIIIFIVGGFFFTAGSVNRDDN